MKSDRLESCLGYLKFSIETEGEEMGVSREDIYSDILDDDMTADDAIASYIERKGFHKEDLGDLDPVSFYPDTKCRVNYFGIRDFDSLEDMDIALSTIRTAELFVEPIEKPLSREYFQEIHKHMFGDIYPSAGLFRTSISGKRSEYASSDKIEKLIADLFWRLESTDYLKSYKEDYEDFIYELAYIMGELDAIHPFLDGNGRACRFFITQIAEKAGYAIRWDSADPSQLLESAIASLDGDYQGLINMFDEITFPIEED